MQQQEKKGKGKEYHAYCMECGEQLPDDEETYSIRGREGDFCKDCFEKAPKSQARPIYDPAKIL